MKIVNVHECLPKNVRVKRFKDDSLNQTLGTFADIARNAERRMTNASVLSKIKMAQILQEYDACNQRT